MRFENTLIFSLLATTGLAAHSHGHRHVHGKSARANAYAPKQPPLTTPWTDKVGTNPWPDYPRPQMQRSQWQTLNGVWKYQKASSLQDVENPPFGKELAQDTLVPACLESGLSGVQQIYSLYSWFSTSFKVPSDWKDQQLLINFDAVDYEATVFVNGKKAGFHRGGYFRFTIDVTSFVEADKENELLVFVHDPTDSDGYVIPHGKQTLNPSHIFYTPCSGIWQSVWIEPVPQDYITGLDINANMDGQVSITVHTTGAKSNAPVEVMVHDMERAVSKHSGKSNTPFQFKIASPKLWSPDSPTLYNVTVKLGTDEVTSYTGFRTISKGTVDGVVRPLLNGEFVFMFGTLDQGFWPDGIYTPPTREAMVYDLQLLKKLGFNSIRKHIKVENELFYRACDELGLLVIQDMPSMGSTPNADQQAEFARQLELLVNQHKSFPSIATWVIYNEGWGQITTSYPEFDLTARIKQLDPTRLVDATTGWFDHGAGDFSDNHHYSTPQCGSPFYSINSSPYDPKRIGIQGEFGGIGHNVSIDHLWNVQEAINTINQTYELDETIPIWNYRAHGIFEQLQDQVRRFACSGGIWTQTTDVEGELNGLMTYDRRLTRTDEKQWQADIQGLYDAAAARSNGTMPA